MESSVNLRLFISLEARIKIATVLIFLILGSLVTEAFAVSLGNNDLEGIIAIEEDNKSEGESANNSNNRGNKKIETGLDDSELETCLEAENKKYCLQGTNTYLNIYSLLDLGDCFCLPLKFRKSILDYFELGIFNPYHILYHRLVFYEVLS
jgi:hypothetical protein